MTAIYVRCRDGAFYKNPVLIFPEGFVVFDAQRQTEAVFWLESTKDLWPKRTVSEILYHVFDGNGVQLLGFDEEVRRVERVVPLSNPMQFRPALCVWISVLLRIPRPQKHDGIERYASRCPKGSVILDLPAGPNDAKTIELEPPPRG